MNGNNALKRFEQRKADHIQLALNPNNQASGFSGLDAVELIHEALPDLDFADICLNSDTLGYAQKTPFYIASMTAGHDGAKPINRLFAEACEQRGWALGVGSQRRQLLEHGPSQEWLEIRKLAPNALIFGNLGLAQIIHTPISDVQRLCDDLQAQAMIVHLNPLQECLQPEGTPNFKGGLRAIEQLCRKLPIPVIIKETGCGISPATLQRLQQAGVQAVDVSGLGGTHWGRIEGKRAPDAGVLAEAAQTFRNWGISTVKAVQAAVALKPSYEIWASGGVRSGLDAAKLLSLGAKRVGFAKPLLSAALEGPESLLSQMETYEYELRVALFCTGSASIQQLQEKNVWRIVP